MILQVFLHHFCSLLTLCGCCCSLVLNILSFPCVWISFHYNIEKELPFPLYNFKIMYAENSVVGECSSLYPWIYILLWCLLGRVKHWNVWTLFTIWVFYSVIKSFSELLPKDRSSRNFWYFDLLISLPDINSDYHSLLSVLNSGAL